MNALLASPLRDLLRPVRTRLIVAVLLQVLSSLAALGPLLAVAVIARVFMGDEPVEAATVWLVLGLGGLGGLVALAAAAAATTISHLADADAQVHIRRRITTHLSRVPLGWFSQRSSGVVKRAVHDDVEAVHILVAHTLLDVAAAVTTMTVTAFILVAVDWRLALVPLLVTAVGTGLFRRAMTGSAGQMVRYGQALGRINSAAIEFIDGIAVVKLFGRTGQAHQRFVEASDAFVEFFRDWQQRTIRVATASQLALSPVVMVMAILLAGGVFVTQGWLPAADLVPFLLFGPALTAPIASIATRNQQLQQARSAAERIDALLREPLLPTVQTSAVPADQTVAYRNVSFSYDGETEVLRNIDLTLEPGTVTALVGRSGGGKSTLAMLLARFFDPAEGAITLGGVDVRDLEPEVLYHHVGFVFQDVQLLRMSVGANIALGRPSACAAEIEAAARAAQIHERIERLPRGYDSILGEDAHLSGGEEQRLSIARLLLADPAIVILDEATAFADPESEAAIQEAFSRLVAGRTVLVVAHRLHSIAGADQIVVLEHGRIVERGTHADLLARYGEYAVLWNAHTRERSHDARARARAGETP